MKAIKFIAVGALLTVLSAPVNAQTANQTALDQVEQILNSRAADTDKQIEKVAKSYKKDAATLTGIGRMYYYAKNYDKANVYADKAKTASKFKYAGAYVLSGDVAAAMDDGSKAAEDYQQAQYLDPKNPDGYIRYAYLMRKSSLGSALSVLEQYHQNNPDYDINYEAAKICKSVENKTKAYEYFAKADKSVIPEKELAEWATDLYVEDKYDESLAAAQEGAKAYPDNTVMKRLIMYNYAGKKDYQNALAAADNLFKDESSVIPMDYQIYASVLDATEQYDKAADAYKTLANLENASDNVKNSARKNMANMYSKAGKVDETIAAYKDYLEKNTNATGSDQRRLVTYLLQKAKTVPAEEQKPIYDEAIAKLQDIVANYPDSKLAAATQLARIANLEGDTELTKQSYETVVETVLAEGKAEEQKDLLVESYNNLMFYYYQTMKDTATAKTYANKILEINPEHTNAQKVAALK